MLTSPQRPLGFAPQGQMSASAASPAPGPLLPPAPPPRCQVLATGRPGSGSSSGLNGSSLRRAGARVAARAAEAAAAAAADLQQGQLAVPEVALLTEGAELLQGVSRRAAAPGTGGRSFTAAEVFQCAEESLFYSQALEKLLPIAVQRHQQRGGRTGTSTTSGAGSSGSSGGAAAESSSSDGASGTVSGGGDSASSLKVVEFGTGDGTPVVNALMKTKFEGVVHGFELNPTSAALAREHAAAFGLQDRYQVHTGCFYTGTRSPDSPAAGAAALVSNPPYLPAPDADILMPELHGGSDGAGLTRDLLSLRYPYAMLLLASYSNPAAVLRHAAAAGYRVVDFLVTPLPFGTYSSQPKVRNWIAAMRSRGEAFYSGHTYLLAGVLFERADLPTRSGGSSGSSAATASSAAASGNGHSNRHGGNGNGNGSANGHSGNGNGHDGADGSLTVYHAAVEHAVQQAQPQGRQQRVEQEEDLAPQLLRLLTVL
ncbi:hypothetical protein CHLRE_03g149750v5 [Chlamydomonas reinhardtii]|uniref:Uncharacterized protein n=1 Tax=Chlamydomonas reinhardtii TaxID=3055 RepID=A0A2K3DVL9_CHLRE|nr:uncharacterized protein CHLRE_03g149750v5 [Chlamydomonas reinhardtii]PNW84578.1 hypothetical protein CHLRE_03g149750v5 [Chlamydomonas reinhardtii]